MIEWNKAKILDIWDNNWYINNLSFEIENCEKDTLVIITPQEQDVFHGRIDFSNFIDDVLIKNNKILFIFSGNEPDIKINLLHRNIRHIYWDSIDYFSKNNFYMIDKNISDYQNKIPKKLFTSLINLKPGRQWRLYIINELYKNNLFNFGDYAFRLSINFLDHIKKYPEYIKEYSLKNRDILKPIEIDSWIPKDIYLDNVKPNDVISNQFVIPEKYMECAFDIVVETLYDLFFITEKTIRSLNSKKPFMVFSCVNYHSKLEQYGFKLYDEIINYGFDSVEETTKRFDAQIIELKKIRDKYTPEDIFYLTKEKVNFNYKKLLEYKNSNYPHYIPNEIRNIINKKEPYLKII